MIPVPLVSHVYSSPCKGNRKDILNTGEASKCARFRQIAPYSDKIYSTVHRQRHRHLPALHNYILPSDTITYSSFTALGHALEPLQNIGNIP